MSNIEQLISERVKNLKPYSSARDEYQGQAQVYLDANESPFNTGLNRYPDPYQNELKEAIAELRGTSVKNIICGNGSDEIIDLLFRTLCNPNDKAIITPPTYGMYKVTADVNGIECIKIPVYKDFNPDVDTIINTEVKLLFLCSPNNPTGVSITDEELEKIVSEFSGLVVLDEAYIDFSRANSRAAWVEKYPNLFIMQTFSKAWGMAGIRLGVGIGNEKIIEAMNKVKPPYNVNTMTQRLALEALMNKKQMLSWVAAVVEQRTVVKPILEQFNFIERVYDSDANFFLVKVTDVKGVYDHLKSVGIIVRDRSNLPGCENCLRITIGTMEENLKLFEGLKTYGI